MNDPTLWNEDLAPVPPEQRTWTIRHYVALWIGMCICIPAYMLAASLMQAGMYWWQALLTITLGNTIVLIPMLLNAHAGARYGIPFPVLLRSSFGVTGANIPAVMRALVACGWFGIQTWIGGQALHGLAVLALRGLGMSLELAPLPVLGITGLQFICFLIFWAMNLWVIVRGIECIRWLEVWSAPLLIVTGLALLFWAVSTAGGFGAVLSPGAAEKIRVTVPGYDFGAIFFPQLTAMIGFWATLSLNIPDFTRYARSQRDQVIGQAVSLPTTMALFSFIGIAVTSATVIIFGEAIWDPVVLIGRLESPLAAAVGLLALLVATLSTNIAANVVSPANDFSNLSPSRISFRTGGIITGVIGVVIMPWRLVSDLGAYIFTWLIGYGAMLGAVSGVMLADYYVVRRRHLVPADLFRRDGVYAFHRGTNWRAVAALAAGIAPNIPGFIGAATNGALPIPSFFSELYTYGWFVALGLSALTYIVLMRGYHPADSGAEV